MSRLQIEPGSPPVAELQRFFEGWPFTAHRWGRDRVLSSALTVSRVQRNLGDSEARVWCARNSDGLAGFSTLLPLAWDTRVLAMPAARLELFVDGSYPTRYEAACALVQAAVSNAAQGGLRHLSIRVDAADDAVIHALEASRFLNVDALMTFAVPAGVLPRPSQRDDLVLRRAGTADAAPITDIAADSFRDGRYHSDPAVPPERARDVYREWAAACCHGSAADAVILAEDRTGPIGFVACRMLPDTAVHLRSATGTIFLIATGELARGRGVGFELLAAAGQWFRDQQAASVEIGTQLRNVSAARLYERCGFRLVGGSLSFRVMVQP